MFYLCAKVTVHVCMRLKNEIKVKITSHDVIQAVFCIIVKRVTCLITVRLVIDL